MTLNDLWGHPSFSKNLRLHRKFYQKRFINECARKKKKITECQSFFVRCRRTYGFDKLDRNTRNYNDIDARKKRNNFWCTFNLIISNIAIDILPPNTRISNLYIYYKLILNKSDTKIDISYNFFFGFNRQ